MYCKGAVKMYRHITQRSQIHSDFESRRAPPARIIAAPDTHRGSIMKATKLFVLSVASSLLLGAVAQAQDAAPPAQVTVAKVVYEGTDAQGRVVRLTIPNVSVATFVRVSQDPNRPRYPGLHWTSQIGTGSAASLER
jgi:hypothetical protein